MNRERGLLAQTVYVACREANRVRRLSEGAVRFVGGMATELLDSQAQQAVTVRIYDDAPEPSRGLFDWEAIWFEQQLPKAPARILVGGCGRGREVRALLERGHEVWAFDPALHCLQQCERDNPSAAFFGWFGYEELVRNAAEAKADRKLLPPEVRFDAVLLGWASLTHVLREADQDALFALLAGLAPDGPILASFFFATEKVLVSGAERLGRRAGSLLARGVASGERTGRVRLLAHAGFVYTFDYARLQALAQTARRRFELHRDGSFPHATFHPQSSPGRS